MVLLRECLHRISPLYCNYQLLKRSIITLNVKYCSTNHSTSFFDMDFKPKFSNVEQEKILTILNHSDQDHLLSLNVSQARIKSLETYKKKRGPFRSLDELLEVDGLGLKILEKLCRQIISEETTNNVEKLINNGNKKVKNLLVPSLPMESEISSIVGIHLASIGVSWAKLIKSEDKQNTLHCWGYLDFINVPKKLFPTDTFKLAINILNQLPVGDVYVFEGSSSIGLQGQKQPLTVTSYTQQMELSSMLLALINTSSVHNVDFESINNVGENLENKVHFLRSKLPARLFKTLVGNECVSSTSTILQLLDSSTTNNFTLPCSPITLEERIKNDYLSVSSAQKELLGQALMLAVAFTDLCVTKNPVSISAVTRGKNKHI